MDDWLGMKSFWKRWEISFLKYHKLGAHAGIQGRSSGRRAHRLAARPSEPLESQARLRPGTSSYCRATASAKPGSHQTSKVNNGPEQRYV